ncbi:MAG: pknD 1 [Gemmataceae bacterium]|nr:pknD 1 [Gemmataceae bacterium]
MGRGGRRQLRNQLPAGLTVTPAPLTVAANDLTAPTDGPIPALTYTVTGLVNGDTRGVVSRVTLSTTATGSSLPGGYPITVTSSFAANYTITARTGTPTLTPSALLVGAPQFVVGTNASGTGAATAYNPDGSVAKRSLRSPGTPARSGRRSPTSTGTGPRT